MRAEGLDIVSAHYVANLHAVELKAWARRGGRGVYINHEACAYLERLLRGEIPPGKALGRSASCSR